jgi:signal transduction histidine kinase
MDPKETTLFTAIIIAAIIIGAIIIYFIISIIRHQRRNQQLYKSKILAEITTLEKERSRMASDLHDELGPVLSSVKLKVNCFDIQSEEDKVQLEKVNANIDNIIQRMREISNDLMPATLQRKGLVAAVIESMERTTKLNGLKIDFHQKDIPELKIEKAIHVYRIIQEVIHNTIKHAKAKNLDIGLAVKNNKLVLRTKDDGAGFNHSKVLQEASGLGLRNLLSRTEILNGEMYIDSSKEKGTEYIFELPI